MDLVLVCDDDSFPFPCGQMMNMSFTNFNYSSSLNEMLVKTLVSK